MFRRIGMSLLAAMMAAGASAAAGTRTESAYLAQTEGVFEEVFGNLEDAVMNHGLVIDYSGHTGDMLARTEEATGRQSPYAKAMYMQFCSAPLSHAAIAADPSNIAVCPYVVFAYELKAEPGKITVGYRRPFGAGLASVEAIAAIEALLQEIVDETAE